MFNLNKFGMTKSMNSTYIIFEGQGIAKLKNGMFETYPNFKQLPWFVKLQYKRFKRKMGI